MKGDLLLIIDMQNVYAKGGAWECMDAVAAAENIRRIVESGAVDSAIITKFIASENPHGVWKDYNLQYKAINEDRIAALKEECAVKKDGERSHPIGFAA